VDVAAYEKVDAKSSLFMLNGRSSCLTLAMRIRAGRRAGQSLQRTFHSPFGCASNSEAVELAADTRCNNADNGKGDSQSQLLESSVADGPLRYCGRGEGNLCGIAANQPTNVTQPGAEECAEYCHSATRLPAMSWRLQ